MQEKFRDATEGAVRRQIAEEFAALLDQRSAFEDSMMALRRGILDLGAAHTAAAQGRPATYGHLWRRCAKTLSWSAK